MRSHCMIKYHWPRQHDVHALLNALICEEVKIISQFKPHKLISGSVSNNINYIISTGYSTYFWPPVSEPNNINVQEVYSKSMYIMYNKV